VERIGSGLGAWTCNVAAESSSGAHAYQPRDSTLRAPVVLASCHPTPSPQKRILISQRCRFCWRKSRKMLPSQRAGGQLNGRAGKVEPFVKQNITHPRLQLEIQSSPFKASRIVHKMLSRRLYPADCNSFKTGLGAITWHKTVTWSLTTFPLRT